MHNTSIVMSSFMNIEIVLLSLYKLECFIKTPKNIISIFGLMLQGKAQAGHYSLAAQLIDR